MSEIIVRNQKILDFYKRNPSLNFEQINLIIIDNRFIGPTSKWSA